MIFMPMSERVPVVMRHRSLRLQAGLLSILAAMAGCAGSHLSERECQMIRDKEFAFKVTLFEAADRMPVEERSANIAACTSGERYTRADFKCIMSAETELEMSRCMAHAHETNR